MKFSTREDIEAPIEEVFREVTNFEVFERSAMRRGANVHRIAPHSFPGAKQAWKIGFVFRGKPREVLAELTELDAPARLRLQSASGGLDGDLLIDLVALSRRRTRLSVALEVRPKTISARLLVQSLKLAKQSLSQRFSARVAKFAEDIESRVPKVG